jgi:mRNA interferase HicA
MKNSEFTRWLKSKGVTFKHGKKHIKLYLNGKQSTLPRHAGEIDDRLRNAIIKQLNLNYP